MKGEGETILSVIKSVDWNVLDTEEVHVCLHKKIMQIRLICRDICMSKCSVETVYYKAVSVLSRSDTSHYSNFVIHNSIFPEGIRGIYYSYL